MHGAARQEARASARGRESHVVEVAPEELHRWLQEGEATLIDVREGFERAAERIGGSEHIPLDQLDPERIRRELPAQRVVFQCRTGRRSLEAAERLRQAGSSAHHLAGGLEAWKAKGLPVERPAGGPRIDVMRQVQISAGSLVLLGVILGVLATPWAFALSAFVGCGLIFAGATGWCGMAKLLGWMPWNRAREA